MSSFLQSIGSLATAGMMLLSGALEEAAPQNDIDGLLFLANRQWTLHEAFEPELVITPVRGQVRRLRPDAAAALTEMFEACKKDTGVTLMSVSGYREYAKQARIYQRKLRSVKKNVEKADEYVARPGASEHQLGLAMDVGQVQTGTQLSSSFGKTKGGKWVLEHCWEYGFILRYNKGWEEITGYQYEPWHVRYVGKENARLIHEADIPLETYLLAVRESVLLDIVTPNGTGGEIE
ncbi:MAG: M15 family metallopeptidase [Clostridia bacterium]|nr:M15 family metallopeptidase [Clostridia bacterium]